MADFRQEEVSNFLNYFFIAYLCMSWQCSWEAARPVHALQSEDFYKHWTNWEVLTETQQAAHIHGNDL